MTTEITIDTGTNELLCAIRDRVAIITLNRPEVRNALSDDLTPALRSMIKTCGENPEVGALLITGAAPRSVPAATSRAWAPTATRRSWICPMTRRSPTYRSGSAC
jgi:1,4-dihydroxy-2-naphthoyl-CoA synthase